ncbi:MAG: hypothetical protein QOG31_1408 [Thermoplasmata archaeon]|jgi:hypothetical protein|nr:hypothetical protein [Thermoplasmata archaeon]
MPVILNKDREAWDPETGFVYNADGTVKRPGLTRLQPLAPAEVVAALEVLA